MFYIPIIFSIFTTSKLCLTERNIRTKYLKKKQIIFY